MNEIEEGAEQERDASQGRRGIGLVGLVAVVLLIGVVAAIAIPGVQRARCRASQKRTMSDMRSMGAALGAYQVDYSGYPIDRGDAARSLAALDPKYIVDPPVVDGWGRALHYEAPPNGKGVASSYTLTSAGSDGREQGYVNELIRYFECDIIYNDGQFVQAPEGSCKG